MPILLVILGALALGSGLNATPKDVSYAWQPAASVIVGFLLIAIGACLWWKRPDDDD